MKKISLKELKIKFIVPMRDKPKIFNGTIPWCRIEDIQGKYLNGTLSNQYVSEKTVKEMNLKVIPKDSVIYSCSATIGTCAITTTDLCTNQTFIGLVPSEQVNVEYLYYQLLAYKDTLKKLASITTIPYIPREKFEDLKINVPNNIEEQNVIIEILKLIDHKIVLNATINDQLKKLSTTLYQYWFEQFDFPDKNGKPYKSNGGAMEYNEQLKREIPKGWEVKNIQKISSIVDCLHSKKPKYTFENEKYFLLQLNNILNNGTIDLSEKYYVSKQDYLKWTSKIEIQENDIIVTNAGRVASNAQVSKEIISGIGRNITAIRPMKISPTYFYQAFNGHDIQRQIKMNLDQGAFFKSFNVKGIKKLNFLIPNKEVVDTFEQIAYRLRRKRELNIKENTELAELRDWLLPMLINGQLKIKKNHQEMKDTLIPAFAKKNKYYIAENKKGFAKQVLAGMIVSLLKDDPYFTDIKFQKIQFLAEHIIEVDLNLNYYYQAAGPYDNKFMHTIFNDLKKNKWFDRKNKQFIPLDKQSKIEEYYQGYFISQQEKLNSLFTLLRKATEAEAEIIATLYAVWNNRIIERKNISDDELITDFYNWSERKQQYSKELLIKGLQWLRNNHFEPTGFGKLIKKAKNKQK